MDTYLKYLKSYEKKYLEGIERAYSLGNEKKKTAQIG